MSDNENRGYGRRKSAPVPSMSVSPMEEVDRKRDPKPSYGGSYKIPKKPQSSTYGARDTNSSGYSRDRDRSMIKSERETRDSGHDYKRRDSYQDTRSPISRSYSKDSDQRGGFGRKIGHHLEEELKFVDTTTSWKDSINDSAPPPGSWTSVEKMGESGLPGTS